MPHAGCSGHTAAVLDRYGAVVCSADVLVRVEWSRLLDETASATVEIVPQGDCCQQASNIRTWRHRLVIWRGEHAVFDGPITLVEWSPVDVRVSAMDASAWLDRRVPHTDQAYAGADLCDIAASLLSDALLPDDGIEVERVSPSLVFGDRAYTADTGLVLDHLRDLSNTGLDWTCAGGRILLMGEGFCDVIGKLSDADFPEGLRVVEDGGATVTRWVMWAGPEGETKAEAGGPDDYYGLLEAVHDGRAPQDEGAASVLDANSAQAAVESQLALSYPSPVFIDTGAGPLSADTALDIAAVIPGFCVEVASTATCRTVTAVQKVHEIRVAEDANGEQARILCAPGAAV